MAKNGDRPPQKVKGLPAPKRKPQQKLIGGFAPGSGRQYLGKGKQCAYMNRYLHSFCETNTFISIQQTKLSKNGI